MRFSSIFTIAALLYSTLIITSCSYKQQQVLFEQPTTAADTAQVNPGGNGAGTSNYRIKSQDILQIRNLQSVKYIVDDVPSSPASGGNGGGGGVVSQGTTYQVEDDGTVTLPVIGHVPIAGLTRAEAARHIENLYRAALLKDPIIELKIVNLQVTVLGEVRAQGNFPLVKDKTTLIEMLGQAGGLTDKADEKTIKIIRGDPKNPQVTVVNLNKLRALSDPGIILQNNDIIYIAQSKRAVKTDQVQNFSTTVQPILLILNTALIIYTLIRR